MEKAAETATENAQDGAAKKRRGGPNLVTATGSHGRLDLLRFYPWELTLVIRDKEDLPKDVRMLLDAGFLRVREDGVHVLYHKKVNRPVREDTVRTIAPPPEGEGQIHNIKIVRDGPEHLVGVGRGRVKAVATRCYRICEASGKTKEEMVEAGRMQLLLATIAKERDDKALWCMVNAENTQREDGSRMELIEDAWRGMTYFNVSEKEAARILKVDVPQLKLKFKLLDLHPEAQEAIDKGEISEHFGYTELIKWPKKDQPGVLRQMKDAGMTKGTGAKIAAEQIRKGETPSKEAGPARRRPSKTKLTRWVEALKEPAEKDRLALGLRIGYLKALGMRLPNGLDEKDQKKLKEWLE